MLGWPSWKRTGRGCSGFWPKMTTRRVGRAAGISISRFCCLCVERRQQVLGAPCVGVGTSSESLTDNTGSRLQAQVWSHSPLTRDTPKACTGFVSGFIQNHRNPGAWPPRATSPKAALALPPHRCQNDRLIPCETTKPSA